MKTKVPMIQLMIAFFLVFFLWYITEAVSTKAALVTKSKMLPIKIVVHIHFIINWITFFIIKTIKPAIGPIEKPASRDITFERSSLINPGISGTGKSR